MINIDCENRVKLVSDACGIIFDHINEIKSHKNPCILVMTGGDDTAKGVACNFGICLEDNHVSSLINDHSVMVKYSKNISNCERFRSWIENDPVDRCVRVISIGSGLAIVYDQKIDYIISMFN